MSTFAAPLRAAFALALLCGAVSGAWGGDLEAKVKAAYLFHLTKFVEWPALPGNEMHLCVVGAEEVGGMMGELSSRQVGDKRLRIELDAAAETASCQILFIGRNYRRAAELLRRTRGQPVLTVGDGDDFARQGGMVGFYMDGGKVKLEVNADNTRGSNLRISAKLLEMARLVQ